MTVVLRHARLDLDPADPFSRMLERAVRRLLPAGCRTVAHPDAPTLRLQRTPAGDWRLSAGAGTIAIDDLAVGAAAARHLAALGARDLRYAGPPTDGLRLRGFSIAAGALGLACTRLASASTDAGMLGIFADGAQAEAAALLRLGSLGLAVPRDALLLGIEDGRLPAPRTPGLSRLRLDPDRVAAAAISLLSTNVPDRVLVPPTGVVTRASSDHGSEDPHLAAALAHLRAHLHRPLDVASLARAAGTPRRTLERLFRAALGRSPLDEIRRQRVERAQELLAGSDLPLEQVAERTGFSGPDRLGVVFRQVAGVTPGAWRRQHRAG